MLKLPWSEEVSGVIAGLYLLLSTVIALWWLVKSFQSGRLVGNEYSPGPFGLSPFVCWAYAVSTVGGLLAGDLLNLSHNRLGSFVSILAFVLIIMGNRLVASVEKEPYGWLRLSGWKVLAFGLCGAGTIQFLSAIISGSEQELATWLNLRLPDQKVVEDFRNLKSWGVVVESLVSSCVIAPLLEEILFRGFIYMALKKFFSIWPAILISGAIFGAIHLNFLAFVPLWLLGSILALVYENTGSLSASVALHGCYNLTTCLAILAFPDAT